MNRTIVFLLIGMISLLDLNAQQDPSQYFDAMEWRNIGPYRGGRSCAVAGVSGKPNLFYFGATGGGVWKTTDGGRSWDNISDGYFGGSIGSIEVAQSDNNVIYVGGGEKTVRGNVSYGYGIWKTENAGKSWTQCGLPDSKHVPRIRIHPKDHNVVFAAVLGDLYKSSQERGVYKSIDGGKYWKKVLFANADAGAVDLIIDPTNPRILYASTWRVRRTPYSLSSGGDGSAIWKSTDSGETWTNISENEGLPESTWGITGITVSPVNGDRIWAIIENDKGGVYRSDDGGETWAKTNDSRSLRQRAWYYTRIYADPNDANGVYVVNVNYHHSVDGGKTFSSHRAPHGDHHDLWIAPENSQRMIIGDDGGAQVSYDGGETWSTYHNQPTSQFYRVTTDNDFPYRIYVAQQDNSTIRIPHRTQGWSISDDDWESTAGGESAHIAVDPKNNDIVYGGSYGGFLTRVNHDKGTVRAINVWPDNPMGYGAEGMKYRFQWNFPIVFSKHNPKRLYTASNHLHMTEDEGQTWKIISPDLTRNDSTKLVSSGGPITKDNTGVEYYCTIFAVNESPLQEGLIWVGSDDGLVHLTRDGGENWDNITPSNMPEWTMINCIEPSPYDAGTCYVAATSYKLGDYKPYLYVTRDYGQTWRKITNGIDAEHFTRAIRVDPVNKGILYAGTESEMYISYNDGQSWQSLQLNLPTVPITDLVVKEQNLIAATQGRGIWILDDLSLIAQAKGSTKSSNTLYQPLPAYRMGGGQNKKAKGVGMNHPGGMNAYYHLASYDEEKDTVNIHITSTAGDTIQSFGTHHDQKEYKIEVEKGSNHFNWNLSYPPAEKFDGMIFWWGNLSGPKAVPGNYQIHLEVNGESQTQSFEVLRNPNSESTEADIKAQFDFIQSINAKVTEAHTCIKDLRVLKKQMNGFKSSTKDSMIVAEIDSISSDLSAIEKELYQTQNRSRQDPLNFPIRLTNKLAHLNSLTQMSNGDFPPTAAAIAVRDELVALIDEQLSSYNDILDKRIPALNKMIREKQVDVIGVFEKE